MRRISGYTVVLLAVLAGGVGGCNTVPKQQYADLEARYNELNGAYDARGAELAQALSEQEALRQQLLAQGSQLLDERSRAEAELARVRAEQQQRQQAAATQTTGGWVETDRTARVTVGTDVLFASGQATLTTAGRQRVGELAATIKSRFPNSTVLVYGHTDSDPINRTRRLWTDNLDLSANRAMAVTRELISRGVSSRRVETVGMAEWHPLGTDKAKNRRVEIVVLK
jgi:flagellar motor protein MotB